VAARGALQERIDERSDGGKRVIQRLRIGEH
jgi:hypothetical protein